MSAGQVTERNGAILWRDRFRAGRLYLAASTAGNLLWEILQLPLFTLWNQGTPGEIAFAVAHCAAGDLLIATATLGSAIVVGFAWSWPRRQWHRVAILTILFGVGYTAFSEWLNVYVRSAWAYSNFMPTLRLGTAGIGLSPLAQWIIVPIFALAFASGRVRRSCGSAPGA